MFGFQSGEALACLGGDLLVLGVLLFCGGAVGFNLGLLLGCDSVGLGLLLVGLLLRGLGVSVALLGSQSAVTFGLDGLSEAVLGGLAVGATTGGGGLGGLGPGEGEFTVGEVSEGVVLALAGLHSVERAHVGVVGGLEGLLLLGLRLRGVCLRRGGLRRLPWGGERLCALAGALVGGGGAGAGGVLRGGALLGGGLCQCPVEESALRLLALLGVLEGDGVEPGQFPAAVDGCDSGVLDAGEGALLTLRGGVDGGSLRAGLVCRGLGCLMLGGVIAVEFLGFGDLRAVVLGAVGAVHLFCGVSLRDAAPLPSEDLVGLWDGQFILCRG